MNRDTISFFAEKIKQQYNVATFFDDIVLQLADSHAHGNSKRSAAEINVNERIVETLEVSMGERYIQLHDRLSNLLRSDIDMYDRICSQGTLNCMHWKGKPLLKSAQDFALYPMLLWELQPKTIIELGSTASSAQWLIDLTMMMGLDCQLIAVDLYKHDVTHPNIQFLQGDIHQIEGLLSKGTLDVLSRPWLIIEDAHTNVINVLEHLSGSMTHGDYLVIEDSISKLSIMRQWCEESQESDYFYVDKQYVDFFGVNSSSAVNSILKKIT